MKWTILRNTQTKKNKTEEIENQKRTIRRQGNRISHQKPPSKERGQNGPTGEAYRE